MSAPVLEPVLDDERLARFCEECGDDAFAAQHVQRYDRMLPERVCAVVHRVAERSLDLALDRVLSLRTSSQLVGACELAALAARIEQQLRDGRWAEAEETGQRLAPAADRLHGRLTGK